MATSHQRKFKMVHAMEMKSNENHWIICRWGYPGLVIPETNYINRCVDNLTGEFKTRAKPAVNYDKIKRVKVRDDEIQRLLTAGYKLEDAYDEMQAAGMLGKVGKEFGLYAFKKVCTRIRSEHNIPMPPTMKQKFYTLKREGKNDEEIMKAMKITQKQLAGIYMRKKYGRYEEEI